MSIKPSFSRSFWVWGIAYPRGARWKPWDIDADTIRRNRSEAIEAYEQISGQDYATDRRNYNALAVKIDCTPRAPK